MVYFKGVLSAPLVLCGYDDPYGPALIEEADPVALPEGWKAIPHGQGNAAQSPALGNGTGGLGAPRAIPAG